MLRVLKLVLAIGVVAFIAIQFVPMGHDHSNPPVIQDAPWPDIESASIARTACYDCHSNETEWPLYSYVAPMSWLVERDVVDGRDELNFSEWGRDSDEADDAIDVIEDREMPPSQYTLIHRDASLTAAQRTILIDALSQMSGDDD